MAHNLYVWIRRIKTIEREYSAMRLAVDRLLEGARRDPTILTGDLKLYDIINASERLEGTYIIRLFAEFETGLRLFWPSARGTDPPSRTRDLIDGVAATRRVPDDERTNVHLIREYRNLLIHERDVEVDPISIGPARSHLCRFFNFLPETW
jgi:hypothetical protein